MKKASAYSISLLAALLVGCSGQPPSLSWEYVETGIQASLRGLSVVDSQSVWISGSGGSVAHTQDGGSSWSVEIVPGAEALDFRDVEAFPDGTAFIMSAGSGALSRIYKSVDSGKSWALQHINPLEAGFFNGMAFWDQRHGVVVGDPVDGGLFLLATSDGGETWRRLSGPQIPRVMEGEFGFAASGTNIATFGEEGMAVVSGGPVARVFRSADRGESWEVSSTPMTSGNASSGIFSIAFRDPTSAMAVGGDYQNPNLVAGTIAGSTDGGLTWALAPEPHGIGFRSCVAWRNDPLEPMWVAVGTPGSSFSTDGGQSWVAFDSGPFNAVAFSGSAGWAAGPDGSVARLRVK